jgi:hypothetical protein
MTENIGKDLNLNHKDGQQIIELLTQAECLIREELKQYCSNGQHLHLQFLLEAQLNVSRALEAMYDRASDTVAF